MQIKYTKTSTEVTESVKDYLSDKLESLSKLVDKHDPNAICEVNLERTTKHHKEGAIYYGEINLSVKGERLRAQETREDLYTAIDAVKDTIINDFKQYKERKQTLVRRGAQQIKKLVKLVRR